MSSGGRRLTVGSSILSTTDCKRFAEIHAEITGTTPLKTAMKIMLNRITGCTSAADFQRLTKPEREAAMRKLCSEGVNIAQISRITGYSRGIPIR